MPLTSGEEKFVGDIRQIYLKNKQIQALADARAQAEKDLAVTFKVDECNTERAKIASNFGTQIQKLRDEIKAIQDNLS